MLEDQPGQRWSLRYKLKSPRPEWRLDFKSFRKDNLTYEELIDERHTMLTEFRNCNESEPEKRRRWAVNLGRALYKDWLPEALRDHLRPLYGELATPHIRSQNPWVPWELLAMEDSRDNYFEWGMDLGLGQWLEVNGAPMPRPIRRIAIFGEQDPQPNFGYFSSAEIIRIQPRVGKLQEALAAGYDLYHFQGFRSGMDHNKLTLSLADPEEDDRVTDIILSPTRIHEFADMDSGFGPIISFGGMDSEQLVTNLGRIDSWART
jgi:hypothetical protein